MRARAFTGREHWRYSGGFLFCLLLLRVVSASAQAGSISGLDRAELLSWIDVPAAVKLLDQLEPTAQTGDARVQWLMARGITYADSDQAQAQAIAQRLHELGRTEASAEAASRIVTAQLYLHNDQGDRAAAELKSVGSDAALPGFIRFRLVSLRGTAHVLKGQLEAATSELEHARDLANAMHSPTRVAEALIKLANLYSATPDLARSASLVAQLRETAQQIGEEILLFAVADLESDIANARGDYAQARRAQLEALGHARRSGNERSLAMSLLALSDIEVKAGNDAAALDYATEGAALADKLKRPLLQRLSHFSMGMAQIGLGRLESGKRTVDSAIQQTLAEGDLVNSHDLMSRYREALEKSGDLRGALEVTHRDDTVRDKLAASARQKALLELSAKFDAERRARQIELLERDNAIKSRDLQAQRLRQQMIVLSAALVVLACGALFWGIMRIRKINARLLHNLQHDAVTGLLNRRYFNEHVLARQGDRPYVGCLLLVGVDRVDELNNELGYAAGDGILGEVAARVANTLPDNDALVRWAGGVFLVLTGPMSDAEVNLAVRRLLTVIQGEPVAWGGRSIRCTVSIGYASFPVQGAAVEISLDRAITLVDKALCQARRLGGNRACLISQVSASTEGELKAINEQFDVAASNSRVQLVETVSAPA